MLLGKFQTWKPNYTLFLVDKTLSMFISPLVLTCYCCRVWKTFHMNQICPSTCRQRLNMLLGKVQTWKPKYNLFLEEKTLSMFMFPFILICYCWRVWKTFHTNQICPSTCRQRLYMLLGKFQLENPIIL